eukprot:TRINITY_DN16612_c0_g2_i1.p1 TRINITY_DN16612_c0_g2~~TRINITY_DN16612_c0_g2_i1.p1  ORF type:complete len:410 (+),score=93.82 TRINITY_DN16612_c0_g2_i1:165-1394(+)
MGCSGSVKVEAAANLPETPIIDKEKVKVLMVKAVEAKVDSLDNLCSYFQLNAVNFTEEEKAFLAYRWMGLNVKYSKDAIIRARGLGSSNVKKGDVLENSGHASVFRQIAADLGIETVIIRGYVKDATYDPEVSFISANHEWNAVKLRGRWQLIDSAWGSGKEELGDYHFCTDPEKLIRTHYPEDEQWQLLKKTISKEEFEKLVSYNSYFYKCGMVSTNPEKAVLTSKQRDKYLIYFEKEANVKLMGKLNHLTDDTSIEVNDAIFVQKYEDRFEVDVAFNRKGKYKVEFFAGRTENKMLKYVFDYIVYCTENSPEAILFPTPFVGYEDTNAILIEPLSGPLKRGETVKFRIKMEKAEEAAVIVGEKWTQLKENEGVFEGEVKISNGDVELFYKKAARDKFTRVLKFETST